MARSRSGRPQVEVGLPPRIEQESLRNPFQIQAADRPGTPSMILGRGDREAIRSGAFSDATIDPRRNIWSDPRRSACSRAVTSCRGASSATLALNASSKFGRDYGIFRSIRQKGSDGSHLGARAENRGAHYNSDLANPLPAITERRLALSFRVARWRGAGRNCRQRQGRAGTRRCAPRSNCRA